MGFNDLNRFLLEVPEMDSRGWSAPCQIVRLEGSSSLAAAVSFLSLRENETERLRRFLEAGGIS